MRCHDSCLFCFWKHLLCFAHFLESLSCKLCNDISMKDTRSIFASHGLLKLRRQVVGTALSPISALLHAFMVMSMYGTVFKHFSLVNTKQCNYTAVKHTHIHNWMMKETFPFLYTISSKIFLLVVIVCFPILWAKALKLIPHLINGLQPTVG